jgi:hypothetical protein
MVRLTKFIPGKSHVDGTNLGVSLYRWINWNRTELDEIIEDGGYDLIEPNTDTYEWMLAETWSRHFERKLEAHWTRQAQARTPLQYEWVPNSVASELRVAGSVKVRKSENGQSEIAIWASTFMGGADVAYNLAYFKAVCQELPTPEVLAVAERERQSHRWQPIFRDEAHAQNAYQLVREAKNVTTAAQDARCVGGRSAGSPEWWDYYHR